MKILKKLMVCLLAVALLCGSQTAPVNAAVAAEKAVRSNTPSVSVYENDSIIITFHFSYSDGSSAHCTGYSVSGAHQENYSVHFEGSSFFGDRVTATATVTNVHNHESKTYGAWCDIYGQTGSFVQPK